MAGYMYANGAWRALQKGFMYANGAWRELKKGFVYANGQWREFFTSATNTYTFFLGNTVHIGTNGYISFDSGQDTSSISATVGRVLGILPADLVTNSIRWAADDSKFYVFYRGRRVAGSDFEIEYEVHFTNGLNYALIKLVAFPTAGVYSNTAYYFNGSRTGLSAITSARTVGAEYRVYFGATAAFATSFTEFGASTHPVWRLASSTPTSGTLGTGYFTIVANQGSSAQAPTGISASSITGTTATVSWTAPTGANSGMSAIQSYDYSLNSGGSWTSTSTSTSVNLTGLTGNTSYTVLVRANNYFFTGTNYASVTFTTASVPGTPTITFSSISATSFTATWAATGATSYNVDAFNTISGATLTDTNGFAYPRNGTTATTATFTVLNGTLARTITVAGVNSAGTGASATKTIAATPAVTFGTNTSTATGFTGSVSNYDNTYTYTASATNSATVTFGSISGSTYNFTVSGLAAGASSTVTITSSKTDAFNGTGSTTGTATAAVPGTPTITFSSIGSSTFTATWAATGATSYNVSAFNTINGNSLTDSNGFVYPRNGTTATTATFNVVGTIARTISVAGVNSGGTGATATKTINATGAITFASNTSTSDGFTGSVNNRDSNYSYSFSASSGTVTPGTASGSSFPFTVTGLAAGGSSTVTVTSTRTDYFNGTGSTTGSATAAATPDVSRIDALGLGNTTAPYIRFTFTSTNAASLSIMLYRSATAATGPWTALGARSIQTTSGTRSVDFSSRTGTTSNWYYVDVIPYANSDGTGTAGTLRTSSVKRGNDTTTTRVY